METYSLFGIFILITVVLCFFGGKIKEFEVVAAMKLSLLRKKVISWKKKYKSNSEMTLVEELPKSGDNDFAVDKICFMSTNEAGASLMVQMKIFPEKSAEIFIDVTLENGNRYHLPDKLIAAGPLFSENSWNSCGLKLVVLEPFVRWRLVFNGRLQDNNDQLHHVRLNFIWSAATSPVYFPADWNSDLIAKYVMHNPQCENILRKSPEVFGFTQYGLCQGEVRIGDSDLFILRLPGIRRRETAKTDSSTLEEEKTFILAVASDGNLITLDAVSNDKGKMNFLGGSVRRGNNVLEHVKAIKQSGFDYFINGKMNLKVTRSASEVKSFCSFPYDRKTFINHLSVVIDDYEATGFLITEREIKGECLKSPRPITKYDRLEWTPLELVEQKQFCVHFKDVSATCPQLVGGKGASLALLTSVQTSEFLVPPGFCLTVNAFHEFLSKNKVMETAIEDIIKLNEKYNELEMKDACGRVVNLFGTTEIDGLIKEQILKFIRQLTSQVENDDDYKDTTFAVRSSAIGEDSEELSAAGQNETILGCRSELDILNAIQACWGSLFAFHSVTYRRMHGQPCNPGMGVVVQCVVKPRAAGVLFSRHPTNGDPGKVLITGNYGLGESVVSGLVEPDTFILNRNLRDELSIESIEIGSKTHRIDVNKYFSGETTTKVILSEKERSGACLSDNECVQLAKIGMKLEKLWAMAIDIEWAVANNKVYLLQARPITTLDNWSEFELLHEMDSPIMSPKDLYTFANTGEVFPGATTPLSASILPKGLERATNSLVEGNTYGKFAENPSIILAQYRVAIDLYNTLYLRLPSKLGAQTKVLEIALIGHSVADDRIHKFGLRRNPENVVEKIKGTTLLVKSLMNRHKYVERCAQFVDNFKIDLDSEKTLDGKLKIIHEASDSLHTIFYYHSLTTSASVFSQVVALSILVENASEFSTEHYSDIAQMLSSCSDVESAEVPMALAKMAAKIYKAGKADEFAQLPPAMCIDWLNKNCVEVAKDLKEFLIQHAHRNIKEFDFATKTWGLDPTSLIQSLQASTKVAGVAIKPKEQKSRSDIIEQLKTPKKRATRYLLRWILPLAQNVVGCRERTKSMLIKVVHVQRLAFLELADEMVKHWFLPDRELIFYFTIEELALYIKSREPGFIKKALKRKSLFPKWNKLEFAEINEGFLEPIKRGCVDATVKGAKLHGTPVCGGVYKARACVVNDLSEIDQLESGDILITHSTDIGWSPYFPVIGGIVTELGGLISHGAVIAREYGLPSLVGVKNVTSFCKTGDHLMLNADEGYLAKIEE